MQSAGNAALIAKFLCNLKALIVESSRFFYLTLFLCKHRQLMQIPSDVALPIELLVNLQTFIIESLCFFHIALFLCKHCQIMQGYSNVYAATQFSESSKGLLKYLLGFIIFATIHANRRCVPCKLCNR